MAAKQYEPSSFLLKKSRTHCTCMQLFINVTAYDHDHRRRHNHNHHHHHHHNFAAFCMLLLSVVLGGGKCFIFYSMFWRKFLSFFSVFCIFSVIVNLGVEHISINKLFAAKL